MLRRYGLFVILLAVFLAVVFFIMSRAIHVSAAEPADAAPEKHYVSYEVKPGDSLWALAEKYAEKGGSSVPDYIAEVKRVNRLESDRILSGTKLYLILYE